MLVDVAQRLAWRGTFGVEDAPSSLRKTNRTFPRELGALRSLKQLGGKSDATA